MGAREVAVSAVLVAVLAACSGSEAIADPDPAPTPTAVPTSPSGSPTAKPTVATITPAPQTDETRVPAAARVKSVAGAQAFAAYFFDLVNDAFQGKSVGPLDGTFQKTCLTCANLVSNAKRMQGSGLRTSRAPYHVSLYTELPESSSSTRAFSAVLVHKKSSVVRPDGSVERVDPEERALIEIAVARVGPAWIVQDIATANVVAQ